MNEPELEDRKRLALECARDAQRWLQQIREQFGIAYRIEVGLDGVILSTVNPPRVPNDPAMDRRTP